MFKRLREVNIEIRRELKNPPEDEQRLSRAARLRLRSRRLAKKFGWRIVAAAVVFYLLRDLLLYVLLPYLALRAFAW